MADYGSLKVTDLRSECEARGLDPHGLKADLVARLEAADAAAVSSAPAAPASGASSASGRMATSPGAPSATGSATGSAPGGADRDAEMVDYEADASGDESERGRGGRRGRGRRERSPDEPVPEGFERTRSGPRILWRPAQPQ